MELGKKGLGVTGGGASGDESLQVLDFSAESGEVVGLGERRDALVPGQSGGVLWRPEGVDGGRSQYAPTIA